MHRHGSLNPPPPGFVLWEGPSRLDGAPVVAIATLRTDNKKTGPMIQTWILRADVPPLDAVRDGQDSSVCGPCPLRGDGTGKGRACYVNLMSGGPRVVWKSYRAGLYPALDDRYAKIYLLGRLVRLGAYGDPVAVPLGVWTGLLGWTGGHTGYTHQWRDHQHQDYAGILMASVESESERFEAKSCGFRAYRILRAGEKARKGERLCPASAEAGHRLTCAECLACDGTARGGDHRDIVIPLHGSRPVMGNGRRMLASIE